MLANIPYFKRTKSLLHDPMHKLFEGIMKFRLSSKTFRLFHSSRREELASIGNGSVMKIVEQFSLLRKIEFNCEEYSDGDNKSCNGLAIELLMKLQSTMDLNGKGKKLSPAISLVDADKVELRSPRLCPPHFMIAEETKNKSHEFILTDSIHVEGRIKSIFELITDLLAVY
nr:uncharacterized protein LOC124816053 [Hydra vulgaris]